MSSIRFAIPSLAAGVLLVSCPSLPSAKSDERDEGLEFGGEYASGRAPVPELVGSLSDLFRDGELKKQIRLSQSKNPDLAEAAARLEEAGFNTRNARAGLFPSIDASGEARRLKTNSSGGGNNFGSVITNSYSASLDAQWEVDVWGRIRAGVAAADADRNAVAADYAAASQSIAAQTAQAYFDLIAAGKLEDLATRRLESFQNTLDLVNRRFELGTADLGELDLARTDVETAKSTINQRRNSRDQASRDLAVLTGAYPDASRTASDWPSLKRGVAAGIPSTLLESRPDIFSAYQRIRAADANVKVAHRDLFPKFSLTAGSGQQSSVLSNLAESNFTVWSLVGGLAGPVIDGGERRAELGAANARAKQALASYRSTVLNAFREVENALGSEQYLKKQEEATARALDAARSAEDRSLRNYESGLVEILTVLDATRRRFTAEEDLISLKNLRFQNRVALALALGKAY
ncbi:efflux transporter outer membrane subunit [Luteolibacter algae]|uniref:Efflux transporter outer membrane subunit n=1 Tax=Luteolibacter algae TaxID=454151 RepID=A0ABW5D6I6_9BACT